VPCSIWSTSCVQSLEPASKFIQLRRLLIQSEISYLMFWLLCRISSLVYCMRTENVVSVMCNGQWIMKDKKILNIN